MDNVEFVNFLEVEEPFAVDFILKQSRGSKEKGISAVFEFKCTTVRDGKEVVLVTGDFDVFRYPDSPAKPLLERLKYGAEIKKNENIDKGQ